jgi:two-component system response regulator WspF
MTPIRIAIVHHHSLSRELLRKILGAAADCQIVWIAGDEREALRKCDRDRPDLLLLDLALPGTDCAAMICAVMKSSPCAILALTESVTGQAAKVFEAMGCGALDAVQTPAINARGVMEGDRQLLKKIATIGKLLGKNTCRTPFSDVSPQLLSEKLPPLVVVGCSTGGPKALAGILSSLPADLGAAMVIVQHVDIQFAGGLAEWLNSQTPLSVALVKEGAPLTPNRVLVAATNDHVVLDADLALHYTVEPRDYPYRPSVNTFFESVRKYWPNPCVAVLLTGMGRDGAEGLTSLRRAGWHTIAQDEKTSVVYGMPAAAVELGGAVEVLPLDKIGPAIRKRIPPIMKLRKGF